MKAIGRFIIGFFVLALFGCVGVMLFAGKAHGQALQILQFSCLPDGNLGSEKASMPFVTYNKAGGACVKWHCYLDEFSPKYPDAIERNELCGDWAQMHLVGSRVQTIQKATDALKSLQELPKRITVVPLSHPSMASMPK